MPEYPNGGYRRNSVRQIPERLNTGHGYQDVIGAGGRASNPIGTIGVEPGAPPPPGFQRPGGYSPHTSDHTRYRALLRDVPEYVDYNDLQDYNAYRSPGPRIIGDNISEYDDPRYGGDRFNSNKVPPTPPTVRAQGYFRGAPWRLFRRINFLQQLLEWLYQYLNSIYGGRTVDLNGWINVCGTASGNLWGSSTTCQGPTVVARASWDPYVGAARLILGNWWASFVTTPPEPQVFPSTVHLAGISGLYRKPDTGPVENPWHWTIDDPDMQPYPLRKRKETRKPRPYNPTRSIDPFSIPMGFAEPEYDPVPYRLIPFRTFNPFYSPVEQTQFGPAPSGFSGRGNTKLPTPGITVDPTGPNIEPRPTFEIDPTVVPPRVHVRPPKFRFPARPGKNVKEKKFAIYARGLPVGILNVTSEVKDFVEAIWKALPFGLRRDYLRDELIKKLGEEDGRKRFNLMVAMRIKGNDALKLQGLGAVQRKWQDIKLQDMMLDLYNNWDRINWEKAFKNLVENEIEDRVFGEAGKRAARASRTLGMSHGIQLGPSL